MALGIYSGYVALVSNGAVVPINQKAQPQQSTYKPPIRKQT